MRAHLGLISFALLSGLVVMQSGEAFDETGPAAAASEVDAVVSRAFENLYRFSSIQRVEIRARTGDGHEFLRSAQVIRSGSDRGLNRLLVRFTGPPDLRDLGVLLLERPDFSYDAFLYQPILNRVRRITVAQRHDSFFGTDLYFEDLESKRASQWVPRWLREDKAFGRHAWVIELVPSGFPSGYERIVAWFDRELPVMLRAEFHRNGEFLKSLEIDPERIIEVEGFLIPTQLVFRSARGSQTTVEIVKVDIRSEIPADRFTRSALEFGDTGRDAR